MRILAIACLTLLPVFVLAQHAMSFESAKEKNIYPAVDSIYKSALHTDREKAVFKTDEEQQKHIAAYRDFLVEFGHYLDENGFKWEEDARGFNRIYMNTDGTIDYFLYYFRTPLPKEKEAEFSRLLNNYIKGHKFGVIAPQKFSQCSPVVFPKS